MRLRPAAFAAWVLVLAWALPTLADDSNSPPERLTLEDAFARVTLGRGPLHPELRQFEARRVLLAAEQDRASMRPATVAGASLENVAGSGDLRGTQGSELTLTLASVLERGGKLDARRALAQSRVDALAVERETRRLDLLADVARRYLAAVAAERFRMIAEQDIAQRRRTLAAARQRFAAGASPESVVFTAQAALARAELERERAVQRSAAARQHLAALWGERAPRFIVEDVDPRHLPEIAPLSVLEALLARTPELAQFADERRVREARLRLAQAEAEPDLTWQVGVRRVEPEGDIGLVGGLSMPLGSRARAQPGIRAAESDMVALEIEREARGMALYGTLVEAHGRYSVARAEVARLRRDVIPALERAEAAAMRAYRSGAISYLELALAQSEVTLAHKQSLDAALDAQRALIELQRLTGQALTDATANHPEDHAP